MSIDVEGSVPKVKKKFKTKEEFKIYGRIFDRSTLINMYGLLKKGYLDTIESIISAGKEAFVLHGFSSTGEVAVKVYMYETTKFRDRRIYIAGDPRFKEVGKKLRKVVNLWSQKEFRNLREMKNAGVSVPRPLAVKGNVLVMEFIGENGKPAPLLKDYPLENSEMMLTNIIENIRRMYVDAKIVHGDLSEYNILVWRDNPVLIDVSQSVDLRHPMAEEFLVRDLKNILNFFKRIGVSSPNLSHMLKYVKGRDEEL